MNLRSTYLKTDDYECSTFGMQGFRSYMEDRLFCATNGEISIFSIFDGHCGDKAVQYVSAVIVEKLKLELLQYINSEESVIKNKVIEIYQDIDNELRANKIPGGTTANVLIMTREKYICINLGDSRCILGTSIQDDSLKKCDQSLEKCFDAALFFDEDYLDLVLNDDEPCNDEINTEPLFHPNSFYFHQKYKRTEGMKTIPLSVDHKPNNELQRIFNAGGIVRNNRACYKLQDIAMSRSFGDFNFKSDPNLKQDEQILTCIPDIVFRERSVNDDYVILATDGLWDVVSNNSALDYFRKKSQQGFGLKGITQELVNESIETLFSRDNVSIVVIKFLKKIDV